MERTEPFYVKFDKINDMLKKDTEHTTENICRCMLEAGFKVNDTFVAVCDEENWTYAGIYPNQSWAESEAKGNYVEQTKRLVKDSEYSDDYDWERTGDTLKTIEKIGEVDFLMPVEYDSIKKTIWIEPFMITINNCPSEEELDPDLINEALDFMDGDVYPFGSYTFDYDEIINKSNN